VLSTWSAKVRRARQVKSSLCLNSVCVTFWLMLIADSYSSPVQFFCTIQLVLVDYDCILLDFLHNLSQLSTAGPLLCNSFPQGVTVQSSLSLTTFRQKLKSHLFKQLYYVFSALTLLVGCQEEHPACKHWMMSVWSKVQIVCMWSSWCQCIPKPRHLLPHLNPDWFFWYRLIQVVPKNRPLNRFGVVVLVVKQSCLDIIRQ